MASKCSPNTLKCRVLHTQPTVNKLEKVFELYALVGILSVSKLYQNDRIFVLTRTEILTKIWLGFC